ncbi:MAG: 4-(cytidine 5'-diphospho)-2-C-methyl-D-erythritol kinase [Pseudomonadota bacterium]
MKSVRLRSPAKINIFLRVLGRRPDGYHEIETLFQEIELADEIILKKTKGRTTLKVFGSPELETGDNIIFKALDWIESMCGRRFNLEILLHKNIPVAAGLGGGSSNAAALICGVKKLFDLEWLDTDCLSPSAFSIGADVPFFLHGGSAIGEGIGEKLTLVSLEGPEQVILINPGFPVSTAMIYCEISKTLTEKMRKGILKRLYGESRDSRRFLHNDLQPVAERLHPDISEALTALRLAGIEAPLMSGSGPTVFGFCEDDTFDPKSLMLSKPWSVWKTRLAKKGIIVD